MTLSLKHCIDTSDWLNIIHAPISAQTIGGEDMVYKMPLFNLLNNIISKFQRTRAAALSAKLNRFVRTQI